MQQRPYSTSTRANTNTNTSTRASTSSTKSNQVSLQTPNPVLSLPIPLPTILRQAARNGSASTVINTDGGRVYCSTYSILDLWDMFSTRHMAELGPEVINEICTGTYIYSSFLLWPGETAGPELDACTFVCAYMPRYVCA